jgi:hypothetical protein
MKPSAMTVTRGTSEVSGRFVAVGGPAPGQTILLSGTITVHGQGGTARRVAATKGRFSVRLGPGVYEISGSSPQFVVNDTPSVCHSDPQLTTVVTGAPIVVNVVCPFP